jgi:OOP family OmpA-OmpF porin
MKSSTRWTIAVLVVIVIAVLLWLWMKRGEPQPPAEGKVAAQPEAPKPEPKPEPPPPVKPVAEEPLAATVLFDYNRSAVRAEEAAKLDDFAARLKGRATDRLELAGHADRIGGDAYNLALARRRAEAVRDYLAGKGAEVGGARVDSKGEAQPLSGDACRNMGAENRRNRKLIECLQRDRRVELRLPGAP